MGIKQLKNEKLEEKGRKSWERQKNKNKIQVKVRVERVRGKIS